MSSVHAITLLGTRKGRGVLSNPSCGETEHSALVSARRSSLVNWMWWTGPPPIPFQRAVAGCDRMARRQGKAPPEELLAVLVQSLEPMRARRSRNLPLETPRSMAGPVQGWAGHSCPSRTSPLTLQGTPDPGVGRAVARHALGESKSQ